MAFEKQIDLIFFFHLFPVKGSEIIITNHFSIHHKNREKSTQVDWRLFIQVNIKSFS